MLTVKRDVLAGRSRLSPGVVIAVMVSKIDERVIVSSTADIVPVRPEPSGPATRIIAFPGTSSHSTSPDLTPTPTGNRHPDPCDSISGRSVVRKSVGRGAMRLTV